MIVKANLLLTMNPSHPAQLTMPRILPALFLAALLAGAPSLRAQTAAAPAPKPTMEARLARALKLFPDADADKDGKLSMPEAISYVEAHPELKAMLGVKPDGTLAGSAVLGGANAAKPGELSTPAASGLPPGPRVFVCAHSFMIFTALLLPPMTEAAGLAHRDAGRQMIGGSRVLQHWNLPDEKNQAKAALREGRVDVLTLSPHLLLPDEGIDQFTKLGLEKNSKLRVLVQASWPARDGQSGGFKNAARDAATVESLRQMRDSHRGGWLKELEAQVSALNAAVGREAVFIVPVSEAVFALRERIAEGTAPGLAKQTDLFKDDLGHPLPPLAVLVTYCHFAAIHQRSPAGLPVPALLKDAPRAEELNGLLQQLAWEAVSGYAMSGVKIEAAK